MSDEPPKNRFITDHREMRARHFTHTVFHLMRDFIAEDSRDRVFERLMDAAHEGNLEIINVPPEWDGLSKLEIERAKLETHPTYIRINALDVLQGK